MGEAFYPLSDVPEIQQEFLRQLQEEEEEEEEKKKKEQGEKKQEGENNQKGGEVAKLEEGMSKVALVGEEGAEGQVSHHMFYTQLIYCVASSPHNSLGSCVVMKISLKTGLPVLQLCSKDTIRRCFYICQNSDTLWKPCVKNLSPR